MYWQIYRAAIFSEFSFVAEDFHWPPSEYSTLYNNQINARALIGQSGVGYCAGKPTEKSRVFWIII